MASADESSLISNLEAATSTGLYTLFSEYLLPFSDLINLPKKSSKNSTEVKDDDASLTLIRSLAKKYLLFLNRALTIIPRRVNDLSKSGAGEDLAEDLFNVYNLCLDCLDSVASQLSCKPYSVSIQRIRMLHCLEAWGRYKDAEIEGFRVLERFRPIDFGSKSKKVVGRYLPDVDKGGGDQEFVLLVVEIVVSLIKCAAMGQSKDGGEYKRVLDLVEEVRPWLRVLNSSTLEKMQKAIAIYMGNCALFLVGEMTCFDVKLVSLFCSTTLKEYTKSSMNDQVYKLAHRMCSSLFSLQQARSLLITDVLTRILDSAIHEKKVHNTNAGVEFLQLVSYCVNRCNSGSVILCSSVAGHLEKIVGDFHQAMTPCDLILKLYAAGLKSILTLCGGERRENAVNNLKDDGEFLQSLVSLLGRLASYFQIDCRESDESCSIVPLDSVGEEYQQFNSSNGALTTSTYSSRKDYHFSYLDALKFLCHPLAELVNSERKLIITEDETASSTKLCILQDAFHQFCDAFLWCQRDGCVYEGGRDQVKEYSDTVISSAVAAFTLSFRTKLQLKRSGHMIKHIVTSKWIQPRGLKHLFASLNNIGVILYRNDKLKEASKALKLCCKASWTCVVHLCQMLDDKTNTLDQDQSEDAIVGFVNEALSKNVFLVDILHQLDYRKVERTTALSLENWSVARMWCKGLTAPVTLVKRWVKIRCKHYNDVDLKESALTLHCLLSSSGRVSDGTIGIILEQELFAYEEMGVVYPEVCQKMQMKIMGILLQDVYVTKECNLEKAIILMKKARALRVYGISCFENSIQCLSEAIASINELYRETGRLISPCCHHLATAYCLRAICTQEVEPNSKKVLEDINAAINLWLGMCSQDHCSEEGLAFVIPEYILLILYNTIDLLSIKGCIEFHRDIYRLMIRLFKWRNVHLEKCLAILWKSRRMNHALCVSPINEAFITILSEHVGESSKHVDFWTCCLHGSKAMQVGLHQNFSFLCTNYTQGSCSEDNSFGSYVTIDKVKEAASELISSDPMPNYSAFDVGYLYYDLCERLISSGHLIEALTYAKEAHRMRTKLFQEKFMYSVELQAEKYDETGNIAQRLQYGLRNLQMRGPVAREVWSFDSLSWDLDDCYHSAWSVLECYLESTLQVGIVHELIGNGSDAETFLVLGKNIACSQGLPLFVVAFSSVLGKLYCKKRLWDLAEEELQRARHILKEDNTAFSCLKCRLMLEVTVDQHLGDVSRSTSSTPTGDVSVEKLIFAEVMYKSALDKLNHCVWKNYISCPEEQTSENLSSVFSLAIHADTKICTREVSKPKMEAGKSKRATNASRSLQKEQCLIPESSSRLTRSRYRSSQNQITSNCNGIQVDRHRYSKGSDASACSDTLCERELQRDTKSCISSVDCKVSCCGDKVKCWQCLPLDVIKSGLIINFIHLKWEYARRRLFLRLFIRIGKCLGNRGRIHEAHENILTSISVLVSRNLFCKADSSVQPAMLLASVGKEIPGDVFVVERAAILYNICWFHLKNFKAQDPRVICCDLSQVQLPTMVSWLMLAFVYCREVPGLFQKVAKLLAVIFIVSSSSEVFSLSCSWKSLSESHWAAYFHQASLGTHLNYQFLLSMTRRCKVHEFPVYEVSCAMCSSYTAVQTCNALRVAPESVQDLEEFVLNFFHGLPCTTIVCISLLGRAHASLLQDLLLFPSCVRAWILVSRLNSNDQPTTVLVPAESILEDDDDGSDKVAQGKDTGRHWKCPWGSAVVDDVAPAFKMILKENFLSSSSPLEDTKKNRMLWWTRRKKLDDDLGHLLAMLEDTWLGPWRYLLLGESSKRKLLDRIHKKLVRDLKSKCKIDVNDSLLKVMLGASMDILEGECSWQLCSNKGCYIGRLASCNEEKSATLKDASLMNGKLSALASQLIHEAMKELGGEDLVNREPVILVLDCEVQMLPWENIPILRNQEVYRMPSVGSILAMLEGNHYHQEQLGAYPLIDPLDAFYLLNPSGDLSTTQAEFEKWFRDLNLEGKAGSAPTSEELVAVLKSHDLFIYFGHGSGAQYITKHDIQKLEKCAATLLMGCSSGSLTLNGCYVPQGIPLSYLLARSPFVVANLWEVTDKDIDRFGKAMLDAWLNERSSSSSTGCCSQCDTVGKEFEAMKISNSKGGDRNVVSKKKSTAKSGLSSISSKSKDCCDHRHKIGYFLGQAREACTLRFLIGAAPVCYGVPTVITRKKDP